MSKKQELLTEWLQAKAELEEAKAKEKVLNEKMKLAFEDGKYEDEEYGGAVLSTITKTKFDSDILLGCLKKAKPKGYKKYVVEVPDEDVVAMGIETGDLDVKDVKKAYIVKEERRLTFKKPK